MKVGDKVIFYSERHYDNLICGYNYILSNIFEIEKNNNDYIVYIEKINIYAYLSEFITIKKYRKLKLQKIYESRR